MRAVMPSGSTRTRDGVISRAASIVTLEPREVPCGPWSLAVAQGVPAQPSRGVDEASAAPWKDAVLDPHELADGEHNPGGLARTALDGQKVGHVHH